MKKLKLPAWVLALLVGCLPLLVWAITHQQLEIRKKAEETALPRQGLSINSFKTSYHQLLKLLHGESKRIANFGGMLSLVEFESEGENDIFAGHLGPFYSPPFYSSHLHFGLDRSAQWRKSFNSSINFYNRKTGAFSYEEAADLDQSFWYPSKMVVKKEYTKQGFPLITVGKKMAIPGYRAFGLKLEITNNSSEEQKTNLLFLTRIPTIKNDKAVWRWKPPESTNTTGVIEYDEANKLFLFHNQQEQVWLALGLNKKITSWKVGSNQEVVAIINDFKNDGQLENNGLDEPSSPGSTAGFVYRLPPLQTNAKDEVTLLVVVDSQKQKAIDHLLELREKDIETISDDFWNQRLADLWHNVPHLEAKPLEKIYYNSMMGFLLNQWEGDFGDGQGYRDFLGLASMAGQSTAEFMWDDLFMSQIYGLADPQDFQEQIEKFLSLDLNNCKAYDSFFGQHNCSGQTYSFSRIAVAQMIYDYVTLTGDQAFLNKIIKGKTVLKHFEENVNYWDEVAGSTDQLADCGHDKNLYELNIHCTTQGGKYTGKVVTPNAERYDLHLKAAEIYEFLGNQSKAQEHQNKAQQVKQAVASLWNDNEGWFDTVTLYQSDETRRPQPTSITYWFAPIAHVLDYQGLLDNAQKEKIITNLKNKFNPFGDGLCSLPQDIPGGWCSRLDFHGPGLYTGEIAHILTGLFKSGRQGQEFASNLLTQSYAFLKDAPYWTEALPCRQPTDPALAFGRASGLPGFINTISFAQAIVKGMFGFEPKPGIVKIAPHVPASLGAATLDNIRIQSHLFKIEKLTSQEEYRITMSAADQQEFKFLFEPEVANTKVDFIIKNMTANQNYKITLAPTDANLTTKVINVSSNSQGEIKFSSDLSRGTIIKGKVNNQLKSDLDVLYIERNPKYSRYLVRYRNGFPVGIVNPGKRTPNVGETVTFKAFVGNKGSVGSSAFNYEWQIDGQVVDSGRINGLPAGGKTSVEYSWPWESNQDHYIEFLADTDNEVDEFSEINNQLQDKINGLFLRIHVEEAVYKNFNSKLNLIGTKSFEDWIQAHITKMNKMMEAGGTHERVRIDEIIVEPDGSMPDTGEHAPLDEAWDGRWGFVTGEWKSADVGRWVGRIQYTLLHELSHQLGLIDNYHLNYDWNSVANNEIIPLCKNYSGIHEGFKHCTYYNSQLEGIMAWGRGDRYSKSSILALESNLGKRRGYFGEYLFDLPQENYLKIISGNRPLVGAQVNVYQVNRCGGDQCVKEKDLILSETTDNSGKIFLPNRPVENIPKTETDHELKPNPFGNINVVGLNGILLIKVTYSDKVGYAYTDISDFNVAYWQGNKDLFVKDVAVDLVWPPTPTNKPTLTSTPTMTETPTPTPLCAACPSGKPAKNIGNANCDQKIDLKDFGLWLNIYRNLQSGVTVSETEKAQVDFDCAATDRQHTVNLQDFNIWLGQYRMGL